MRLNVSLSAAHSCGLYPDAGISTHVSEGVRVSEGCLPKYLAQELAKEVQRREAIIVVDEH